MIRPLSSFRAPAEARASEIPHPTPEVSTEDVEIFWTDGLDARSPEPDSSTSISPERVRLISEMLFASRSLVGQLIKNCNQCTGDQICDVCSMHSLHGKLTHLKSCAVRRVDSAIAALIETSNAVPAPVTEEAMQAPRLPRASSAPYSCGTYFEPWFVQDEANGHFSIKDCDGDSVLDACIDHRLLREVSLRVAACVNFCADIPTSVLLEEKPLADMSRSVDNVIAVGRLLPGFVRAAEVRP